MAVVRHALVLPIPPSPLPAGIEVRPWKGSAADRAGVELLVAACGDAAGREGSHEGGPDVRATGLVADLASRPGRQVDAWLARGPAGECLGLVTLVATATGWSIGWLLVHPMLRRQGLGRGLVSIAAAAAMERGAVRLSAETLAAWPAASGFWGSMTSGDRP